MGCLISTRKKASSGWRKPRVPRPKKYLKPDGSKYDSIWEAVLHESILKDWEHHTDYVSYVIEHKYEPDFVRGCVLGIYFPLTNILVLFFFM